jgi:DNA processing protein
MEEELLYQLALTQTPGIGPSNLKQLIAYCGNARAVFQSPKNKLQRIPGIGIKTITSILSSKNLPKAEAILKECKENHIRILFYTDSDYPNRLKQISDAPPIVYYKGNQNLNQDKIISIVGTRQATDYGKAFTETIIKDLSAHKPLIVSGLAYGIDICAHRAAMRNGLPTVGITASGLDIIYPPAHKETAFSMIEQGGLLSEYPPGVFPDAHHFPERNRIIAGMADAVIVIEAARRGGALITAEIANNYSKDVFALPGNINQKFSEGCNNLIKTHKACLLTGVKDLEYIMNWNENTSEVTQSRKEFPQGEFSENEIKVLQLLFEMSQEMMIDEISWKTQIPVNQIASLLLNLEFKGLIKALPGKKFKILG